MLLDQMTSACSGIVTTFPSLRINQTDSTKMWTTETYLLKVLLGGTLQLKDYTLPVTYYPENSPIFEHRYSYYVINAGYNSTIGVLSSLNSTNSKKIQTLDIYDQIYYLLRVRIFHTKFLLPICSKYEVKQNVCESLIYFLIVKAVTADGSLTKYEFTNTSSYPFTVYQPNVTHYQFDIQNVLSAHAGVYNFTIFGKKNGVAGACSDSHSLTLRVNRVPIVVNGYTSDVVMHNHNYTKFGGPWPLFEDEDNNTFTMSLVASPALSILKFNGTACNSYFTL